MKWFFLLPLWLLFNVLALLLNWLLPAFAMLQDGPINNNNGTGIEPRLPSWLSYFMTPDNSLLGDGGFKESHDGGYWSQVAWLYRNSAYGFERSVLAAKINPTDTVDVSGDPFIQDKPAGREGTCYTKVGDYWAFDYVRRVGASRCIKICLGWKLKTYAEYPERVKTQPVAQYTVSPRITTFIAATD